MKSQGKIELECDKYPGEIVESILEIENLISTFEIGVIDSTYYSRSFKVLCSSYAMNYDKGIADACNIIGYYYYERYEVSNAVMFFSKALSISESIDYTEGLVRSQSNMGLLNGQIQNYDNALIHFTKVYELGIMHKNNNWLGEALINIGKIHLLGKNYKDAEDYLKQSIEVLEPLGNVVSLGWAHTYLGELYSDRNNINKGHYHLNLANEIMISNHKMAWSGYMLNVIGELYKKSDPERSLQYYKEALAFNEENQCELNLLNSNYLIGEHYLRQDNYLLAKDYFFNVYKLSSKIDNLEYLEKSTAEIAKLYSENDNTAESVKFYKLNVEFKAKIIERKNTETYAWLASERDMLKIEHNSLILSTENILKTNKLGFQVKIKFLLIIITLLFLILIMSLFYVLKNKRKKTIMLNDVNNSLNMNLEKIKYQAKVISESNLKLNDQKKMLESDLKSKLLILSENQSQLQHLSKYIESLKMDSSIRKELFRVIETTSNEDILTNVNDSYLNTNKEFFKLLCKVHPNLTANNLKLCACIKMNLKSSEIANLLFISNNSVKVALIRLRDKLGVSSDDSLESYLNSIEAKVLQEDNLE